MTEQDKELEALISKINKQWGEGALISLGDKPKEVEVVSTGILPLDIALDVGGLPKGRIVEIYGQESSGKTTICQYIVASAQKSGGKCAYIDMEHALDPAYAELCGVDVASLLLAQPSSGEEALEITETLIRSGKFTVIVVDSVAALVPQKELEGDMGDATMGLQARLMSQAMRKLSGVVAKSNTILVFTNQIRQKLGIVYGSPDVTTGGLALKFYASIRLEVRKSGAIKGGGDQVGNEVTVKVTKNKVGRPFRRADFSIIYGKGIDGVGALIDLAVDVGVIDKKGAFYYFGGEKIGHGKEQSVTFLSDPANKFSADKVLELTLQKAKTSVVLGGLEEGAQEDEL